MGTGRCFVGRVSTDLLEDGRELLAVTSQLSSLAKRHGRGRLLRSFSFSRKAEMSFTAVWRTIQRWLAGGRTVAALCDWLQIPVVELRTVPRDYRQFSIPKRSGGQREILAPNDRLKALQRRIHRRLLRGLSCHPAAMGFERDRCIVDNALPHCGQAVVLNLDIVEFFRSTSAARVQRLFRRCGWGRGASRLLTDLCTYEGFLPPGAPTSPRLSNLVNRFLDQELTELAAAFGARYTRYADDLTFSFAVDDSFQVRSLLWNVRRMLWHRGYPVHHRRKLSIRRRHQRQQVTGLVVNEQPRLPRSVRRRLRAVEHRLATRGRATMSRQELDGWLSFERMIRERGQQRETG